MDRGQVGQPHLHRFRAGRLPQGRDGAAPRRKDPRRPDAHRRRSRRLLLRRAAEQVQDRPDALGVRRLRHPRRAPDGARRVHEQGAGRRGVPVLVPGHRGDVLPGAHGPGSRRRPGDGPGGVPPDELRAGRRLPAPDAVRLPHRLRPVRQVPGRRPQGDRLREFQGRAGGGPPARPAARPRHLHDDRAARRGQQPRVRHPRHQDVRLRRSQGAHDGQGDPPHRGEDPGAGPRDDLGADRRARAGHSGRRRGRRGRRHRHRAVRDGHLRVQVHAGRRGGRRHGVPQDPGQGPQAGGAPARGVRGRRRVGARPVLRAQLAEPGRDHPGMRDGRVQQHAGRHGAGA